jgi:hypothetical protein
MAHTKFQKAVKQAVEVEGAVYADKVVCKADGSVEVKHSFFYRHGNTADKWATKVFQALEAVGIESRVDAREDFRQWPAESYFVAIVNEPYRV